MELVLVGERAFFPRKYYETMLAEFAKYVKFTVTSFEHDGRSVKIAMEIQPEQVKKRDGYGQRKPRMTKKEKIYNWILCRVSRMDIAAFDELLYRLKVWRGRIAVFRFFRSKWMRGQGVRKIFAVRYSLYGEGYLIILWRNRAMILEANDIRHPDDTVTKAVSFPLDYWSAEDLAEFLASLKIFAEGGAEVLEILDEIRDYDEKLGQVIEILCVANMFWR